jgi:hypothetical protein
MNTKNPSYANKWGALPELALWQPKFDFYKKI